MNLEQIAVLKAEVQVTENAWTDTKKRLSDLLAERWGRHQQTMRQLEQQLDQEYSPQERLLTEARNAAEALLVSKRDQLIVEESRNALKFPEGTVFVEWHRISRSSEVYVKTGRVAVLQVYTPEQQEIDRNREVRMRRTPLIGEHVLRFISRKTKQPGKRIIWDVDFHFNWFAEGVDANWVMQNRAMEFKRQTAEQNRRIAEQVVEYQKKAAEKQATISAAACAVFGL